MSHKKDTLSLERSQDGSLHGRERHKESSASEHVRLEFQAPEYEYHPKSILWFILAGGIALLYALWNAMRGDWTFAIAILACAAAYYSLHRRSPRSVHVRITDRGIHAGHRFYHYEHIKQFWIVYDPPYVSKMYLRFRSKFRPDAVILLMDQEPKAMRRALGASISEWKEGEEPLADIIARALRL